MAEAKRPCPGRLALCGVPCGCNGENPSHHQGLTAASTRATFLWNGPLEINPAGGYRPAPCTSAGSIYREEERRG